MPPKTEAGSLSAQVLGQITLMQGMITSMQGTDQISDLICSGLIEVPGISKVEFDTADLGSSKQSAPETSYSEFTFPLTYRDISHGKLHLTISSEREFSPYRPFIENLVNMVAVVLSERQQNQFRTIFAYLSKTIEYLALIK
ncbi:MAG: hypothetical protein K9N38_01120 [Candidatus Marinimicrobia bacterium]|nr:hypothetical protein [Candidatus Neomarinimicrobiota bacterium]MCF7850026.1 hypothetical protein [Candidatus Neomarinimicrobiota bacterium]